MTRLNFAKLVSTSVEKNYLYLQACEHKFLYFLLDWSLLEQTWTEAASLESMLSVGEKRCLDGENMILVLGGNAGGTSVILASISWSKK